MDNEQAVLEISAAETTKSLLSDLKQLSMCAEEPVAAVFADSLLRKMRSLHDTFVITHQHDGVRAIFEKIIHLD
jgi:hypothetical protein